MFISLDVDPSIPVAVLSIDRLLPFPPLRWAYRGESCAPLLCLPRLVRLAMPTREEMIRIDGIHISRPPHPCFASAAPSPGLPAVPSILGGSAFAGADCTGSGKISRNIPGKNLSSRFHVSSHNLVSSGFSDGGTRYSPFAMTRRMFFRLSGTASSYNDVRNTCREIDRMAS